MLPSTQLDNLVKMSTEIDYWTGEPMRKRQYTGPTIIAWDDDAMRVASSKKFKCHVLDTTMPNVVKVMTDKLERDITELEVVITNIQKMHAR